MHVHKILRNMCALKKMKEHLNSFNKQSKSSSRAFNRNKSRGIVIQFVPQQKQFNTDVPT